jgi:FixJ family two-component response regulator
MTVATPIVYLLDDEPGFVKALTRLLHAEGFAVRGYTSIKDFLAAMGSDQPACLVLDVNMPELNGMELQSQLSRRGLLLPIIFLSAHGDIPMSVRAIKAGAVDFLTKPVDAQTLVPIVHAALNLAEARFREQGDIADLNERYAQLTSREREVMAHVVSGQLNKQIAGDLGTVEQTIKVHRSRIMQKMGVQSVADLVRMAARLGIRD